MWIQYEKSPPCDQGVSVLSPWLSCRPSCGGGHLVLFWMEHVLFVGSTVFCSSLDRECRPTVWSDAPAGFHSRTWMWRVLLLLVCECSGAEGICVVRILIHPICFCRPLFSAPCGCATFFLAALCQVPHSHLQNARNRATSISAMHEWSCCWQLPLPSRENFRTHTTGCWSFGLRWTFWTWWYIRFFLATERTLVSRAAISLLVSQSCPFSHYMAAGLSFHQNSFLVFEMSFGRGWRTALAFFRFGLPRAFSCMWWTIVFEAASFTRVNMHDPLVTAPLCRATFVSNRSQRCPPSVGARVVKFCCSLWFSDPRIW